MNSRQEDTDQNVSSDRVPRFASSPDNAFSVDGMHGFKVLEDQSRASKQGIRDYRASGAVLGLPYYLGKKAEALHLADRTSEALEAIKEAEALVERFEDRHWSAELRRLRGVFLAAIGAEETQIEASFRAAISTAKQQKSTSLATRAEITHQGLSLPHPRSPLLCDPSLFKDQLS
jgi:hypothetical protein